MENVYIAWDVLDTLIQIGIYLALVKGLARVAVSLFAICRQIENSNDLHEKFLERQND